MELVSQNINDDEWAKLTPANKIKILKWDFSKIIKFFMDNNSHPWYLTDIIHRTYFPINSDAWSTLYVRWSFFWENLKYPKSGYIALWPYNNPVKEKTRATQNEAFSEIIDNFGPDTVREFIAIIRDSISKYLNIDTIDFNSTLFIRLSNDAKKQVVLRQMKKYLAEHFNLQDETEIEQKFKETNAFLLQYWKDFVTTTKEQTFWNSLFEKYYEYFIKDIVSLTSKKDIIWALNQQQLALLWAFFDLESTGLLIPQTIVTPEIESQSWDLTGFSLIHNLLWRRDIVVKWLARVNSLYQVYWFQIARDILNSLWIDTDILWTMWIRIFDIKRLEEISYNLWTWLWISKTEDKLLQLWIKFTGINSPSKDKIEQLSQLFSNVTNTELISKQVKQSYKWGYVFNSDNWSIDGVFPENWLVWSNFAIQKTSNDTSDLYLNLSVFDFDTSIYLTIQFLYFLETWSFLDSKILYTLIYTKYSQVMTEWNRLYDITTSQEYWDFIEKIVFPHSKNAGVKKSNVLLMWLPGTWKSQMTMHLIWNSHFTYNWVTFELDCLVIPLKAEDISDFTEEDSTTRQRLMQISERTWKHLLIVIEDIDVALFSRYWNSQVEKNEQVLTNLLEGIWALQNVTILSNTNNPSLFPERLIRGGRFDTLIPFFTISHIETSILKIREFIKSMWFESFFTETIIARLWNNFIGLTYSTIWDFFSKVQRRIEFKKIIWDTTAINEDDLLTIFNELNTSKKILKDQEQAMKDWLENMRDKEGKQEMWFKPNK